METDLRDLADRVRFHVRQCPNDDIVQALLDTIRDFCNWTRCYQLEDNDTIQALISDYDLALPSPVELVAIEYMTVDGTQSFQKTPDWLARYVAQDWRTRKADDFRYFTQLQPQGYTFPCVPTKMGTLQGIYYRVSVRPTLVATTVDQNQANEWLEAWSAGAVGRLKSQGGNPAPAWFDPEGAKVKTAEYLNARGWARVHVNKAYGNTQDRVTNRGSFARGSQRC